MAKGGFVVNVDGKQMRCHCFEADYDDYSLGVNNEEIHINVKDWSTLSVHAVTKKEAEDIVSESILKK